MPRKPHDVLVEAENVVMQRGGPAPKGLTDLKNGDFSLHHTLPYRYAWYTGRIVDKMMTALGRGDTFDLFGAACEQLLRFSTQGTREQRFAWMGVNLFEGPSGDFRLDDPGSAREARKPLSFSAQRWETLQELGDLIDSKVTFTKQVNDQYAVDAAAWKVFEADTLLALLQRLAGGHASFHAFQKSDWVVLDLEHHSWTTYARNAPNLGTAARDEFRRLMGLHPRAVVEYRVTDFTRTTFAGSDVTRDTCFWRLREDGEALPSLKIVLNFAA